MPREGHLPSEPLRPGLRQSLVALPGAARPTTAAMGVWRNRAVSPSWRGIFSLPTGTTSSVVSEQP